MVASAAMQLFMRTLQATNMELRQIAAQAISSNPALEDTADQTDILPAPTNTSDATARDFFLNSITEAPSLSAHLEEQLRRSGLSPNTEKAALLLLQHLDSRGFFEDDPAHIAKQHGLSPNRTQKALAAIHDLDPAGVGARDLRQCLMLQLARLDETNGLPMELLKKHWEALVKHRYKEAAEQLGVPESRVIDAAARIARLNPNPGAAFSPSAAVILQPDIDVSLREGKLRVRLTGTNIPRLALSAEYRDMMAEKADNPEIRQYLSRCFREGRELIRAIEQRQQTILRIAQAIVEHQQNWFLKGPEHMRPLRMEDIAAETELHVSTISRAVNGKFLRFGRRVLELRHFFSASLPAENGATSAKAIQARIQTLIANENPAKPLSDAAIESLLEQEGLTIARRTIAKYRDLLHILPASLRKKA